MSYKPVGGVRSVSLHAANAVGINREGLVVELAEDRSSYVERLRVDDGVVVVEHTLTLVAHKECAAPWLEQQFIDRTIFEGVVAKITLNSGEQKSVGYSEKMLFEQPMRLKSIEIDSALSAEQIPTVKMILYSEDTTIK